jgi:predicted nucleic acid-binding protein
LIYLDTSFLVSLYSPDINFDAAVRVMQATKGESVITTLGALEVVNALGLRVFRKDVSPSQAQASLDDF